MKTNCCHGIELRECEQCSRMLATEDQLMTGICNRVVEFHCVSMIDGKCWQKGFAQCEYCQWVQGVNTGPLTKEEAESMTKRAI